MTTPDAIEPISAYRGWRVTGTGLLQSWYEDSLWPGGEMRRAERNVCTGDDGDEHPGRAPDEDCICGLYGMFRLEDVVSQIGLLKGWQDPPDYRYAIGRAEYWGKTIIGTHGLRAEFARAVEVFPFWPGINYERLGVSIGPPLMDMLEIDHEVLFLGGPIDGLRVNTATADLLEEGRIDLLQGEAVRIGGDIVRGLFRWLADNLPRYRRIERRAFVCVAELPERHPRESLILAGDEFTDLLEQAAAGVSEPSS